MGSRRNRTDKQRNPSARADAGLGKNIEAGGTGSGTGKKAALRDVMAKADGRPVVVLLTDMAPSQMQAATDVVASSTNRKVESIDLSQVVSKYIGETEKNLDSVFAEASKNGWILFFDEADALFGKRTSVKDAHDEFATVEASYLADLAVKYDVTAVLAVSDAGRIETTGTDRVLVVPGSD